MAGFVDTAGIFPNQHLAGGHANIRRAGAGPLERGQPPLGGFGIVIDQRHEVALRGRDALVVGGAEAPVFAVTDHPKAELRFRHLRRAVGRTVVHHDDLKCHLALPLERVQTGAQQLLTVPVHHHDGDQATMLAGAARSRFDDSRPAKPTCP